MSTELGGHSLEDVIDELARVLHDRDAARELALRAGFPPADLPAFSTSLVFWSRVVRAAEHGKILGGARAILEQAARAFPANPFFSGQGSSTSHASAPSHSRGGPSIDNRGATIGQQFIVQGDATFGSVSTSMPTKSGRSPGTDAARSSASAAGVAPSSTPRPSEPESYDVFLSHCSADKPAVEPLAARLQHSAGLRPFFDAWHLVPGESWLPAIERALSRSTTVAVFFGPQGMGPWHEQEMHLAQVLAAQRRGTRVIPVLLPGAHEEDIDGFLSLRTWVKLSEPGGFDRLVAGIEGQAPGPPTGLRPDPGLGERLEELSRRASPEG